MLASEIWKVELQLDILSKICVDVYCSREDPPYNFHILKPYKEKEIEYSISLYQLMWLYPNHVDEIFQFLNVVQWKNIIYKIWPEVKVAVLLKEKDSPGGHHLVIFVTGRWWGRSILLRKHNFVIILSCTGRRPNSARFPEKGIFCFWPFP